MHDGESVCMRKLKGNPDTFDIASFVSDLRLLRALPSSSQPLLLPEYVISVIILSVHALSLILILLICCYFYFSFSSLFHTSLICLHVDTTETYTIQWRVHLRSLSVIDHDVL